MNARRIFFVAAAVLAFFACRENIPDEGPKQPANSPLPEIQPPTTTAPSPIGGFETLRTSGPSAVRTSS